MSQKVIERRRRDAAERSRRRRKRTGSSGWLGSAKPGAQPRRSPVAGTVVSSGTTFTIDLGDGPKAS